MTTPIFGTQTAADLARWLIPPDQQAAFASLDLRAQLSRLAQCAHAKREYAVRDACTIAARAVRLEDSTR